MGTALGSFKVKLVLYFVLLSLLPIAAAFWGFTSVAGQSETRRVDARLQAGLRSALTTYQGRLDDAQSAAQALASNRAFQAELQQGNLPILTNMLRDSSGIYVLAAGNAFHVGPPPPLAGQRLVQVFTRVGLVGTVYGYVPLNNTLVDTVRQRSGLAPSDSLAIVRGTTIVASSPDVHGNVLLASGRTKTIEISGVRYRALVASTLGDGSGVRFAVLSPQSLIDAANSASRDRLLLGLLASLALVSIVAYFEGRSIVRTLSGLAEAAHGIARGRFSERVPVKGRDEFALLGTAFNDMAGQLEARVSELEEERARFREAIDRFGDALAATHDIDQLLDVIVQVAVEATGATGARLSIEGGAVVENGDPLGGAQRLDLPLAIGGRRLGTLILVGSSFDEEQRLTAVSLASHAAIALENARLHRIVERQALVDGLTGVANRRRSAEALSAEVARAERHGTPLSIVLADLDDFKNVNDAHGHAAGDNVLREFAAVLRATLRESDLAGRWGGEEFLLLLPGTDATGAAQLADRVRMAFSEQILLDVDGGALAVTCSFGVTQHQPGQDEEDLFAEADRALYSAKRQGKNRVATSEPIRAF
jgi:diguanylate cyclase (GGDEF)-like protein